MAARCRRIVLPLLLLLSWYRVLTTSLLLRTLSPAVPVDDRIPRIPRLYLASPADKMTRFAQVQAHMEEAKRAGFDVRAEVFEDSGHVAHARVDPARYWAAINKLWRHASSRPVAARL